MHVFTFHCFPNWPQAHKIRPHMAPWCPMLTCAGLFVLRFLDGTEQFTSSIHSIVATGNIWTQGKGMQRIAKVTLGNIAGNKMAPQFERVSAEAGLNYCRMAIILLALLIIAGSQLVIFMPHSKNGTGKPFWIARCWSQIFAPSKSLLTGFISATGVVHLSSTTCRMTLLELGIHPGNELLLRLFGCSACKRTCLPEMQLKKC